MRCRCCAADRVRLDFWRLLRRTWTATWHDVVREVFPGARLRNYGAHQDLEIDEITPSVDAAWNNADTFGLFILPAGRLVTRVTFVDVAWNECTLAFYYLDADNSWSASDGLALGEGWIPDLGWRTSDQPDLSVPGGDRWAFDPAPLAARCRSAMIPLSNGLPA